MNIPPDEVAASIEGFNFIQLLRLRHQHFEQEHGRPGDNLIRPDDLNEIERRVLKEAFRQARKLQARLNSITRSDHELVLATSSVPRTMPVQPLTARQEQLLRLAAIARFRPAAFALSQPLCGVDVERWSSGDAHAARLLAIAAGGG
jgi:hypothetical protein